MCLHDLRWKRIKRNDKRNYQPNIFNIRKQHLTCTPCNKRHCNSGLTLGSYITGKDVESKDRFIDEFGTQAIWLGGIPFFKKITDLTLYKLLGIDPKFDVRNLKNKDILAKAIEKAPTEKIRQSIIKAAKNPKFTKNLALGKFAFSTVAAICTYTGLTRFRQNYRLKEAKEKLKQNSNRKPPLQANILPQKTPNAFEGVHKDKKKW